MLVIDFIKKLLISINKKKDHKRLILSLIFGVVSCYIFVKIFNYFFKLPFILLIGTVFGLYIYKLGFIIRTPTIQ